MSYTPTLGERIRSRSVQPIANNPWTRPAVQPYRSSPFPQPTSSRDHFVRVSFEDAQSMFHRPTT